jgi:hypothetical protein
MYDSLESCLLRIERPKLYLSYSRRMSVKTGRYGLAALFLLCATGAQAQSRPEYIPFAPVSVKGALFRPDVGPAPHVGVLVMHRTINSLPHIANTELSRRGFLVLGMNPRFDNNDFDIQWEDILLDMKSGVQFLRRQPGITRVVLLGYSGGGPTMGFYQAVAEKGMSYCQGPAKMSTCTAAQAAGLVKADGIVFIDPSPGAAGALRGLNPAITDEARPQVLDAALDPFNPENGFVPDRPVTYSEAFRKRYYEGQSARMNRLIADAQGLVRMMAEGTSAFPDDDVIVIPRAGGASIASPDPSIDPGTVKPARLLRNDGSVATEIVHSILPPIRITPDANATFAAARVSTVRTFLSTAAIRSTNAHDGVDWCSSNTSTPCALEQISVPVLFTATGAGTLLRDTEVMFEHSASKDKDFVVVEGLLHALIPCNVCGRPVEQWSNGTRNLFDYIATWINKRF